MVKYDNGLDNGYGNGLELLSSTWGWHRYFTCGGTLEGRLKRDIELNLAKKPPLEPINRQLCIQLAKRLPTERSFI